MPSGGEEVLRFSGAEVVVRASGETTRGAFCIIEEIDPLDTPLRGVRHAQRRVVPRTGRILTICTPAGLEGFFRGLAEADAAGTLGPEAYARVSEQHGITWLPD